MNNRLNRLSAQFKERSLTKKDYVCKMHRVHNVLWEYRDFIQNKNIGSIEISQKSVHLTTQDGITMTYDNADRRAIPLEILNFGDYESSEIFIIRKFIKRNSVVLDIGANIGWYCLNLSKNVPNGRILAFEPIPKTFRYLTKNIELNNSKNIELFNFGFHEKEGICEFLYDPKASGAASLVNLHDKNQNTVKCKVKRLDDFIPKITTRIDFIKCDVEGGEIFVIKGGIETIRKMLPGMLLEMLRKWAAKFGYHPNEIIKILGCIGYNCYFEKNRKLIQISEITNKTESTNFYFFHKEKHRAFLEK